MTVKQAPPGAVPYVKIVQYSPLHLAVSSKACAQSRKAYLWADLGRFPSTRDLIIAVRKDADVAEDDVVKAIEELRSSGTLLMLPNSRLAYCSYDSH